MKLSDRPCQLIRMTPVRMLSGIDRPITTVGRRVFSAPLMAVGLSVMKNANTTAMARVRPSTASRSRVLICLCIDGPSLETVTISISGGRPPTTSRACVTASVTSIVLASGSLMTDTPKLRLPFVRDMLVTSPEPRDTSATSPSVTGAGGPASV